MMKVAVVVVALTLTAAIPSRAQSMENCPMHQQHQAAAAKSDAAAGTPAVRTLSAETVQQLQAGTGMGMAKPAELNHFPGPRHVLDLSDKLQLSDAQIASTKAIFDTMHEKAIPLGQQILDREQGLDQAFATKQIDVDRLQRLVMEIAHLQAQLRVVHLQAHMEEVKVLNPEQVRKYDALRGYGSGTDEHANHQH